MTNTSNSHLDFGPYIAEHAQNFTGREWVFQKLNSWLDGSGPQKFLLTCLPGGGKTAIAARLVQISMGQVPANAYPRLRPDTLAFYHFCRASRNSTLQPLRFLEALSQALAARYKPFAHALKFQAEQRQHMTINTAPVQNVGRIEEGGKAIGVNLELHIGDISVLDAFDIVMRQPLEYLCQPGFDETILLLVDSLDEALTINQNNNILTLLESASDLPDQVRWLLTSRRDNQVQNMIERKTYTLLDLIGDAPANTDDVRVYAYSRLTSLPEPQRTALVSQVAQAAKGNFLYARHVLDDLPLGIEQLDLNTLQLPKDLEDVYHTFLRRAVGNNLDRWQNEFRPLMGSLTVTRGEGLRRDQLAEIIHLPRPSTSNILSAFYQYLTGTRPEGPFQIYHKSFSDFLLQDKTYEVFPAEANTAIADYLLNRCGENWEDCRDDYAVHYTAAHLADASRLNQGAERHRQAERLLRVMTNTAYQRRIADPTALQRGLELALRTACVDDEAGALALVLHAAAALLAFRREYLQSQTVFDLAASGKSAQAEERLALFGPEPRWRQAAQLLVAWLAAPAEPQAARAARDRLATELVIPAVLMPLLIRLDAELNAGVIPAGALPPLPPPPPTDVACAIVSRMGGGNINPSFLAENLPQPQVYEGAALPPDEYLLGSGSQSRPAYLGEQEGPLLISYAVVYPAEGTLLLREYIRLHAANNYVYYRNMSLWGVLDAVLRHPDPTWAKSMAREIVAAALSGSQLEFDEGVGTALTGLAGTPDPKRALEQYLSNADQQAHSLLGVHGPAETWGTVSADYDQGDAWGANARRLAALAECFASLVGDGSRASQLLDQALWLPRGFAGYRASAQLMVAEALWICGQGPLKIEKALDEALSAAHNVTDPIYCVRMTARVNAIRTRWAFPPNPPINLPSVADKLLRDPADPDFAAIHQVGDEYKLREVNPPLKLRLPDLCYTANTLRVLASVYQQPLAEFKRLNPIYAPDATIPANAWVNVPDPEFAPMLAARLASEALTAPGLSAAKRTVLIQLLVPVARANPTALDTVLARMLLAAKPKDPVMLQELVRIATTVYAPPRDSGDQAAEAAQAQKTLRLGPA